MGTGSLVLLVFLGCAALGVFAVLRLRNMQYWIGDYLATYASRRRRQLSGSIVYVCFADHFEPFGRGVSRQDGEACLDEWLSKYPGVAQRHSDSFGNHPRHTFFYPLEDYDPLTLDRLAALARQGFADIEVHYHHDNDTAGQLTAALENFRNVLHNRHGLLRTDGPDEQIAYCFIHGNWALDNSRPDGRWCGVNDELSVLVKTGCRADLTMPSAPSDTQTAKINSIYFARGRPGRAKSHDTGRDAGVGQWGDPDELLLIQGPLGLNWQSRKLGLLPRIENGEISADAPPARSRVRLWARLAPMLSSREQHIFVKLHTHGATEATRRSLLGGDLDRLWSLLEDEYRDRPGVRLRYVTAWEMYSIIRDLAQGRATRPDPS